MSPYDYAEGEVAVPANRCTRCGGPLVSPADARRGTLTGWFRPSKLRPSIWNFRTAGEPADATPTVLACPACDRRFHLFPAA